MLLEEEGESITFISKIFIWGLTNDISQKDIITYYGNYCPVRECIVMIDKNILSGQGFGFITIDNEEMKEKILMAPIHVIKGYNIKCSCNISRQLLNDIILLNKNADYKRKVVISNIPFHYTAYELFCFFKYYYGEICQCLLIKDTNAINSYCFITLANETIVDKVLKDNSKRYFHGNIIQYTLDKSKESLLAKFDILFNTQAFSSKNNPLNDIDNNISQQYNMDKQQKRILLTSNIFVLKPSNEFNSNIQIKKIKKTYLNTNYRNEKILKDILLDSFSKLKTTEHHGDNNDCNDKKELENQSVYNNDNDSDNNNCSMLKDHLITNDQRESKNKNISMSMSTSISMDMDINTLKKNMINNLNISVGNKMNHYLKYKLFDVNGDLIHINNFNNSIQIFPLKHHNKPKTTMIIPSPFLNQPTNPWMNKPPYTYQTTQHYPHPIPQLIPNSNDYSYPYSYDNSGIYSPNYQCANNNSSSIRYERTQEVYNSLSKLCLNK